MVVLVVTLKLAVVADGILWWSLASQKEPWIIVLITTDKDIEMYTYDLF